MTTPSPRIIPAMLRALRHHHGLTQRQLAEKLEQPQSRVAEREHPDHSAGEDVLTRYATSLGYPDLLAMLEHGIALLRPPQEPAPDPPRSAPDVMTDLLTRHGWSRRKLARQLGVSPSLVVFVLQGKRRLSREVRERLDALHGSTESFRPDDEFC